MNAKKIRIILIAILSLIATRTLEAATAFNTSPNITVVDSFREAHPLLMLLFNIGGIFLLVGVCASICSVLVKNPWDK